MKFRITSCCGFSFICVVLAMYFTFVCNVSAAIAAYPAPPGLVTSPDFTVKANDTPIWVERIGSQRQSFEYLLYNGRALEDLNVANFSCSGAVTIKITASEKIDSYVIRPKSRNIKAQVRGQDLTFTISGPQKLYLEINGLPVWYKKSDELKMRTDKAFQAGLM